MSGRKNFTAETQRDAQRRTQRVEFNSLRLLCALISLSLRLCGESLWAIRSTAICPESPALYSFMDVYDSSGAFGGKRVIWQHAKGHQTDADAVTDS
jgi:hypothetical protein